MAGTPRVSTVYIVIDLVLLAGLGLFARHLAGLRRWRREMQGPAGHRLWALLPSILVDVALPYVLLKALDIWRGMHYTISTLE